MKGASKPKAHGAKARKERDEDLLLFREMFKREKERNVASLLDPVSSEFESSQGSFPLYKFPSGKKGAGNDFLGAEKEKNDYDWLKTPPATPLFPSLEMEANDPNMIFQRELPILQHIKPSRFSAKMEEAKVEQRPKSPSSRSTTSTRSESSSRSETPRARPTSSSSLRGMMMNLKERSSISTLNSSKRSSSGIPATTNTNTNTNTNTSTNVTTTKENPRNICTPRKRNTERKPRSRGVSPMSRPRLPTTLPGFSDEAPPNLITSVAVIQGRATSATRGRPGTGTPVTVEPKAENAKVRRQSCSPSVTRGRKVETIEPKANNSTGNGTLVIGSRMVERMMNARRSSTGGEAAKDRNQASERPRIGRLMSKTSVDMALKQLEISKNQVGGLKSSTDGSSTGPSNRTGSQTTANAGSARNLRIRSGGQSKFPIKEGESRNKK